MNEVFYINTSPIIFQIGPIKVGWYGVMVALAVIVVIAWGVWQNRKTHAIKSDSILGAAAVAIPTALIVSKLIHVIDQWDYYIHNPGRIISGEGLTIWGAVLGATLGAWLYSKISKQFRFTAFGDMLAPGIILAQAIGRVGCTFNGCCYGIESNSSFSIVYTNPNSYGPLGIPVLPTQVFEIFYNLIVFGVLLALRGHFKKEGTLFYIYLFLYGAWRFGIDFIRDGTPFLFGLHQAQVIGLIVMIVTVCLIFYKNGWKKKGDLQPPAGTQETETPQSTE